MWETCLAPGWPQLRSGLPFGPRSQATRPGLDSRPAISRDAPCSSSPPGDRSKVRGTFLHGFDPGTARTDCGLPGVSPSWEQSSFVKLYLRLALPVAAAATLPDGLGTAGRGSPRGAGRIRWPWCFPIWLSIAALIKAQVLPCGSVPYYCSL